MSFPQLRGKIREVYGTQARFAKAIGFAQTTLSCKLNGKTDWTKTEIVAACKLLHIPLPEAFEYFG